MASNNIAQIRKHIQGFTFEDLFIDELGWELYRDHLPIAIGEQDFILNAFAEKRGLVAFHYGDIPEYGLRRKIEQQVAKTHRENIIIYTNPDETQQIWQWVRREPGRPLANRERQFHRGQSGENIAQVLANIAFSLDEEDTLTIVDVTSRIRAAFDVEQVTKRFYDRFKRQHDAFLRFIEGIPDDDLQRWYASVMLNRLMFIYFVQKKYFLDNDPDYLRNRLAQTDGNFYQDFLCPLFFEGFAKKEHPANVRALLGDVPYLNGGLFLRHQIEEQYGTAIQIADSAFERLFDFFDEYRWHLDERPLRDDNEINPDVLGYIFEKYINQKQMGAYYTKEDITEYISKNTVIPFLFDEARKAVRIAFEGEHTIWDLLVEAPDRYIYPAVRHGVEHELPENIAVGLDDVSQRGDWNTPAPSDYGLPTEIWREVVARRTRYAEVREKLINGDVRRINDLITYNLDIQQFAQDVIDYTDSPDVVRAFWKAINDLTVLDPTAGSGAFLFAALNILEPLYEACVERMEGFVAELDRIGDRHPQTFSDFRDVLVRVEQHPNRRYFILKSIIVNNLFGVDIMEEAVEICKLRLFLKLVAQVDDKQKIEPLPDIDFNIRAGNTLVGFATLDQLKQAITNPTGNAPKLMLLPEDEASLKAIEQRAQDVDRLFGLFREQQTSLGGEVRPEDKAELNRRLHVLENELNHLLANQYGVDPIKEAQYTKWLKTHQPFHWFVEFYGVLKNGGFDVIIGNPPWKEYSSVRKTYTVRNYKTESGGNLYNLCAERSLELRASDGLHSFIVQLPLVSSSRMSSIRKVLADQSSNLFVIPFDDRPGKLFSGLQHCRSTIYFSLGNGSDKSGNYKTTKYQRWYSEVRDHLFQGITFVSVNPEFSLHPDQFAKYAGNLDRSVFEKAKTISNNTLASFVSTRATNHYVFYQEATQYWVKATVGLPYYAKNGEIGPPAHGRYLYLNSVEHSKCVGAIMNSSLFYAYFVAYSDGFHLSNRITIAFPVDEIILQNRDLMDLSDQLMTDLEDRTQHKTITTSSGDKITYAEFYAAQSKTIIDEIDHVLARHYGFTDEELDFIINYDIKYRMGDDLFDEEDEEEEEEE